jgi:hypothetical protein
MSFTGRGDLHSVNRPRSVAMTATVVEREIHHLSDLLLIRSLLADRGVARDELEVYEAEIAKARERLAEAARSESGGLAA